MTLVIKSKVYKVSKSKYMQQSGFRLWTFDFKTYLLRAFLHSMQYFASGTSSRRACGISLLQRSHTPYFPFFIASSAILSSPSRFLASFISASMVSWPTCSRTSVSTAALSSACVGSENGSSCLRVSICRRSFFCSSSMTIFCFARNVFDSLFDIVSIRINKCLDTCNH